MKKQLTVMLLIAVLGLVSWATAQIPTSAPFDVKKSQQELEIMRGILSTTLGFVANDLRSRQPASTGRKEPFTGSSFWSTGITSFYLYGQGAVFVVPMSGLRGHTGRLLGDLHGDLEALDAQMSEFKEAQAAMAEAMAQATAAGAGTGLGGGVGAGVSGGVSGGVPGGVQGGVPGGVGPAPPVPQPPKPPAAPKPATAPASQDEMRKRLFEAQEKVKQRREQSEQERQKLMEDVAQAKVYLIEALANHGDSLTTVKPNEYINLVITTDGGNMVFAGFDEPSPRREVISVQKSVITDYKAGRLSLDAFKQKVLQYQE